MLIFGNVGTSSGLKRKLSSNILGLDTITPQDQDFESVLPSEDDPPCSIKLSALVCTFPFGLYVK